MRILLVEDNDDSREVIRFELENLGYEVAEATNGGEALKAAIKRPPDLVLMDLSMPEVDGFEAIAALRAVTPLVQLPIVAITAYPQSYWRDKAEDAGFADYVQKPVSVDQLSEVLRKHLKSSTAAA